MPTIKESIYFTYDGISSERFGLMNVVLDNGMYEESLHASREIRETSVMGNDTPLLHGVDESPLEFELTLGFKDSYTDEIIENVILWLFQNVHKPLYFNDKPDKIFYCMPIGESSIAHNGLKQGYITLTMRCNSSKVFSPTKVTQTYDLSSSVAPFTINIENKGHTEIYPEISLYKVTDGNITITVDNKIFEIRNLLNGEDIYIDCFREIIETDATGIYRYENVVGDFLNVKLKRGNNAIKIEGRCRIAFRYRFKYKF